MANVNTADIGFEGQTWAAADILRGYMDAAEYKHVVLGLIFLKYISDTFEARYQELEAYEDDVEDKDAYAEVNVFFVPPSARWGVIALAAQIPVSLWFIGRNKEQKGKTLFLDARKMGTMVNRELREMTSGMSFQGEVRQEYVFIFRAILAKNDVRE
jgi:type I restriction enzyme M protein